jgi:hypothetical protein
MNAFRSESHRIRFLQGADQNRRNREHWDKENDAEDWFRETHNRRLRHAPILKDEKQQTIVDFLASWFSTSHFSAFQFEGEARVALRVMLIGKGHSWQRSDDEAHRLIQLALHKIGAKRPPKEQCQPEWTMEEWCGFCRGPLDDEAIARHDRYCCVECARMALTKRAYGKGGYSADYYGQIAYRQVRREELPVRACKNCGETFRPNTTTTTDSEKRQYCSRDCWYEARRTLPTVECQNPNCNNVFRQRASVQQFCSQECAVKGRSLLLPIRDCAFCGTPFQPKISAALYCSPKCNQRMKDARQKEKRRAAKAAAADPDSPIQRLFDEAA